MTQLFKPNEQNTKLFEVMKKAKSKNITVDMVSMHNEIIGSKALGAVIFDEGLIDFGFEIDRQFFIDHYLSIFEAMTKPITLETHRILIRSILGDLVDITFEIPNPGHLIVNIEEKTIQAGLITPNGYGLTMGHTTKIGSGWAVRPDKGLETRANKGFAFRSRVDFGINLTTVLSRYTIEQARNLLENIVTEGVFTEFNFTIKGS